MERASPLNPFTPEAIEDPYPVHRALRDEGVVYVPDVDTWCVSRFADVEHVLQHHDEFSSRNVGGGAAGVIDERLAAIAAEGFRPVAVLTPADPPEHSHYRWVVARSFSPQAVGALEDEIRAIVDRLIDRFVARGECDLVSEFAAPFPLHVFAQLVGVPESDIPQMKAWTDDRIEMMGAAVGRVSRDRMYELARSNVEAQRYLYGLIEEVRAQSGDDLLSHMVHAHLPGFGDRQLDDDELMSMVQTVLDGGNETTVNLVSNGMALLLQHPHELARLRADPSLIANAVEEVLRVESPVQCLFRTARADVSLGGVTVPEGARLAILYGAANRDPRRWERADELDVGRADARKALHFGAGIHFCLGEHLARLEGRVAFEALTTRLANLRLHPTRNDFRHHTSPIVRGLRELWVQWDPA